MNQVLKGTNFPVLGKSCWKIKQENSDCVAKLELNISNFRNDVLQEYF